jgi:hypothetical protein
MVDNPSEELRPYKAYVVPYGVQPNELIVAFAKVITLFYNEGYDIDTMHELPNQQMTLIIFKLRGE